MTRLEQLTQFLNAQPDEPFLLFALAKEYEGLGDSEKALAYYLRLRETTPQYVGLYYHLGKLYVKRGQITEALEAYTTGMTAATTEGDRHAYSELAAAKMDICDDEEY